MVDLDSEGHDGEAGNLLTATLLCDNDCDGAMWIPETVPDSDLLWSPLLFEGHPDWVCRNSNVRI